MFTGFQHREINGVKCLRHTGLPLADITWCVYMYPNITRYPRNIVTNEVNFAKY